MLASSPHTHRRGRLRRWLHSLYVAAVVGSGVHLLHSWQVPLELPATAMLAGVAQIYTPAPPDDFDARRHLAVVAIDDERFKRDYRGASPLDRCTLRNDLQQLLSNPKIQLLAIDLDLSPTDPIGYQAYVAQQKIGQCRATGEFAINERTHRCQCELEQFLQQKSKDVSIITISPLSPTEGRFRGEPWDDPTVFPHIQFGQARLDLRFGMVYDYAFWPPVNGEPRPPIAELITLQMCELAAQKAASPQAFAWPSPERCDKVRQQPKSAHPYPISYFETRYLHNGGFPLGLADPCLAGQAQEREARQQGCDIRMVLLGGSYGLADHWLTPLGERNGLEIHGAIAAQLRSHTWSGVGFVIDILLGGLLFGPLAHWMWGRYFAQRCQAPPTRSGWRHPRMAYGWFIALGLAFGLLVAGLAVLSTFAYAYWGWWISPVPMAIGMLIEAAIGSGVHAATHELEHAQVTIADQQRTISGLQSTLSGVPAEADASASTGAAAVPWATRLPTAVAWLLIGIATYGVLSELF